MNKHFDQTDRAPRERTGRDSPSGLVRAGSAASGVAPRAKNAGAKNAGKRDDDVEAYLIELGHRVRSMRAVRGMSRKVLAQASGVSERYIAQLESGQGNVSIVLLRRVAEATGAPVEDFVAETARQPQDWTLIRELLRKATPAMIADAKAA
ncbi:MAG: helix-turn-helix domain-containing protein, partial [Rhodoblastus sp.]